MSERTSIKIQNTHISLREKKKKGISAKKVRKKINKYKFEVERTLSLGWNSLWNYTDLNVTTADHTKCLLPSLSHSNDAW